MGAVAIGWVAGGCFASYVTGVINAATKAKDVNALTNAGYMLKAQMLATALNVYFSDLALGGNKIAAPQAIGGITESFQPLDSEAIGHAEEKVGGGL